MADLGERLSELRRSRRLSQESLADALGVSRQAVSNWERSNTAPDTINLVALADFYSVSLDELLGHELAPLSAMSSTAARASSSAFTAYLLAVVACAAYYAFVAHPLFASTLEDLTDMLGLTVSPALGMTVTVLETVFVALPFLMVVVLARLARRPERALWLAPLAAFVLIALAPIAPAVVFGLPVREYAGIGAVQAQSVVAKADVLGVALGCALWAAFRPRHPSNKRFEQAVSGSINQ